MTRFIARGNGDAILMTGGSGPLQTTRQILGPVDTRKENQPKGPERFCTKPKAAARSQVSRAFMEIILHRSNYSISAVFFFRWFPLSQRGNASDARFSWPLTIALGNLTHYE